MPNFIMLSNEHVYSEISVIIQRKRNILFLWSSPNFAYTISKKNTISVQSEQGWEKVNFKSKDIEFISAFDWCKNVLV